MKNKEFLTKEEIIEKYDMSASVIDKFFPEPFRYVNHRNRYKKPLYVYRVMEIEKAIADPYVAEKIRQFRRKRDKRIEKERVLRECLESFSPDSIIKEGKELDRIFIIHVGPTNSGKTYNAIERLKTLEKGCYLAPLRLLALEIYDKVNESGKRCNLLTGEERIDIEGAECTSSTIEMADFKKEFDIAVIDEAQLISDQSRGSHWLKAICMINAKEVHICMSPDRLELVISLIEEMGSRYEVKTYERLTPLKYSGSFKDLLDVKRGDCVIAFSRKNVLSISGYLEQNGIKTSVIYGALPPEVRKAQIRRYTKGEAGVIVATDAIGMGVSLPIKRIIFAKTTKFDGQQFRDLKPAEVKQIAGRAGRYGIYDMGEVLTMENEELIEYSLESTDDEIMKMRIPFPREALDMNYSIPEILDKWNSLKENELYLREDVSSQLYLSELVKGFNVYDKRFLYDLISCQFDCKNDSLTKYWLDCFIAIMKSNKIPVPYFSLEDLKSSELQYSAYDIYYQMCGRIGKHVSIEKEKEIISNRINKFLLKDKEANVLKCKLCGKPMSMDYRFGYCRKCFYKTRY